MVALDNECGTGILNALGGKEGMLDPNEIKEGIIGLLWLTIPVGFTFGFCKLLQVAPQYAPVLFSCLYGSLPILVIYLVLTDTPED